MKNLTEEVLLETKYAHIAGKYKCVRITGKTKSSIEFTDSKGYVSWMGIDEFLKTMKLIK